MLKTEIRCLCGNTYEAEEQPGSQVLQCPKCGRATLVAGTDGEVEDAESMETYGFAQSTPDCAGAAAHGNGSKPEQSCPKCKERMDRSAVICVYCGWDKRTGKCHHTRTDASLDGERVSVSMGFGSGVPPQGKRRMPFRGSGTIRFRADGLRVRGKVLGDPVIAAVFAAPLGVVLTLLTIGFGTLGGLVACPMMGVVCFCVIREKLQEVESLNSDGSIHRAYFDAERRLVVIGLENGRWACCRLPRKQLTEIRETLRDIYGDRLSCTRVQRFTSGELAALCVLLGTPTILLAFGVLCAIGLW